MPEKETQTNSTHRSMDSFLASVEKQAYVVAYARTQNQDSALDIVQDSMLNMVKNYSNKPTEQWKPLFFKLLQNRITDQYRKRGLGRLTQWFGDRNDDEDSASDAVDQLTSEEIGPLTSSDSQELSDAIGTAIEKLSFKQQQVLMLRLWQGLSVKETASAMGISDGSVKTHLSRAVNEMRKHLQEYSPL